MPRNQPSKAFAGGEPELDPAFRPGNAADVETRSRRRDPGSRRWSPLRKNDDLVGDSGGQRHFNQPRKQRPGLRSGRHERCLMRAVGRTGVDLSAGSEHIAEP